MEVLDHNYTTGALAGVGFLEDSDEGLKIRGEMPLDVPEVASAATWAANQGIRVAGAGAAGADLVTTVSSIEEVYWIKNSHTFGFIQRQRRNKELTTTLYSCQEQ